MTDTQIDTAAAETKSLDSITQFGTLLQDFETTAKAIEVVDEESCGIMAGIVKKVSNLKKKVDEDRTSIVKPINDSVKTINARYKPLTTQCDEIITKGKAKMQDWHKEEHLRLEDKRKEELEKAQAQEAEALEAAEKLDKHDATEVANVVLVQATQKTNTLAKVSKGKTVRGDEATSSATRHWKAEVINVKDVCKAIGAGRLPEDIITISQSKLDDLSRLQEREITEDGIRYYLEIGVSVR